MASPRVATHMGRHPLNLHQHISLQLAGVVQLLHRHCRQVGRQAGWQVASVVRQVGRQAGSKCWCPGGMWHIYSVIHHGTMAVLCSASILVVPS